MKRQQIQYKTIKLIKNQRKQSKPNKTLEKPTKQSKPNKTYGKATKRLMNPSGKQRETLMLLYFLMFSSNPMNGLIKKHM